MGKNVLLMREVTIRAERKATVTQVITLYSRGEQKSTSNLFRQEPESQNWSAEDLKKTKRLQSSTVPDLMMKVLLH